MIHFFIEKGQKDQLITEKFLTDTQNFLKKKMTHKKKSKTVKKKKLVNNNNEPNKSPSTKLVSEEKLSGPNDSTEKKTSPIKSNDEFLFTSKPTKNSKSTDFNLANDEEYGPLTESDTALTNEKIHPINNTETVTTVSTSATYARSFMKAPYGWLVDFINHFGELNGFKLFLLRKMLFA